MTAALDRPPFSGAVRMSLDKFLCKNLKTAHFLKYQGGGGPGLSTGLRRLHTSFPPPAVFQPPSRPSRLFHFIMAEKRSRGKNPLFFSGDLDEGGG
jgi:hypothetical protein